MRIILALILGLALGAAAVWYFQSGHNNSRIQDATNQVESAAKSAGDAIQEKLRVLDLRPQDVKDELARSAHVVRRKPRDLSALSISVNTTAGVVTLSGTVPSTEAISKAMLLAMETDGVKEVISTLQVKSKAG